MVEWEGGCVVGLGGWFCSRSRPNNDHFSTFANIFHRTGQLFYKLLLL